MKHIRIKWDPPVFEHIERCFGFNKKSLTGPRLSWRKKPEFRSRTHKPDVNSAPGLETQQRLYFRELCELGVVSPDCNSRAWFGATAVHSLYTLHVTFQSAAVVSCFRPRTKYAALAGAANTDAIRSATSFVKKKDSPGIPCFTFSKDTNIALWPETICKDSLHMLNVLSVTFSA